MLKILVVNEKYGTYYYDASTPELLAAASVQLLKERLANGYIYEPKPEHYEYSITDEDRKLAKLTTDEVSALPDTIREDIAVKHSAAVAKVARAAREFSKDLAEYRETVRIVENSDTSTITVGSGSYERQEPRAWRILESRSGYEYENVTIEDITDPTKD